MNIKEREKVSRKFLCDVESFSLLELKLIKSILSLKITMRENYEEKKNEKTDV